MIFDVNASIKKTFHGPQFSAFVIEQNSKQPQEVHEVIDMARDKTLLGVITSTFECRRISPHEYY